MITMFSYQFNIFLFSNTAFTILRHESIRAMHYPFRPHDAVDRR